MRTSLFLFASFLILISGTSCGISAYNAFSAPVFPGDTPDRAVSEAERRLLPDPFPVYSHGTTVVNHGGSGGKPGGLPTKNQFTGAPGCYVACYSRAEAGAIYSVGGGIQVMGQVRVPGRYERRICRPHGHERDDISALPKFKALCNRLIPACADCWTGGDTGGWFGISG